MARGCSLWYMKQNESGNIIGTNRVSEIHTGLVGFWKGHSHVNGDERGTQSSRSREP